jgi:tRNA(Ile)-lysidine synthase
MTLNGFAAAFRRHFPDILGRPILVALSGGADSVALLSLFHESVSDLGCVVSAAHVHHHQRGVAADGDAAYCRELCNRLGVKLVVEHLAPERPRGTSPEAWWRRERYRALEAVRERLGCAAVATAHTRDDQAETVLLKLFRGSGPRGVAAIRRRVGLVVRPLLDVPRAALREYLAERELSWREDGSNADLAYPRARVRHGVLPAIVAAFPHAPEHIAAFASSLAADEVLLSGLLAEHGVWPEVGRPVPSALVAALPAPLLRRWVLELAGRLPLAEPPSRRQLDGVSGMLESGQPAAVDLGRRWVLRLRGNTLLLQPPPIQPFAPRPVALPSRVELPGGFVGVLGGSLSPSARHRATLHSRLRERVVSWRSVVPGERFGGAAVMRRLAAKGLPAQWRQAWPVLLAGDTIVWLPAVGVAEGWGEDGAEGVAVGLEEPWERHDR